MSSKDRATANWFAMVSVVMTDQKTYLQELGKRICAYRKEAGLTQNDLGQLIGLSQQVIADYETGNRNISIYTLARIAEALGMEVGEFAADEHLKQRRRGPVPYIQRQMEKIQQLPKNRRKFVLDALDMALKTG